MTETLWKFVNSNYCSGGAGVSHYNPYEDQTAQPIFLLKFGGHEFQKVHDKDIKTK